MTELSTSHDNPELFIFCTKLLSKSFVNITNGTFKII